MPAADSVGERRRAAHSPGCFRPAAQPRNNTTALQEQQRCERYRVLGSSESHWPSSPPRNPYARTSIWCQTIRNDQRHHEDHPALRFVKEAFRQFRLDLGQQMPVMVTRLPLATIAIGIVEKNSTTRTQVFFSKK